MATFTFDSAADTARYHSDPVGPSLPGTGSLQKQSGAQNGAGRDDFFSAMLTGPSDNHFISKANSFFMPGMSSSVRAYAREMITHAPETAHDNPHGKTVVFKVGGAGPALFGKLKLVFRYEILESYINEVKGDIAAIGVTEGGSSNVDPSAEFIPYVGERLAHGNESEALQIRYGQNKLVHTTAVAQHVRRRCLAKMYDVDDEHYRREVGSHEVDRSLCPPTLVDPNPTVTDAAAAYASVGSRFLEFACELTTPWRQEGKSLSHLWIASGFAEELRVQFKVPRLAELVRRRRAQRVDIAGGAALPDVDNLYEWRLPTEDQVKLVIELQAETFNVTKAERYALTSIVQRRGGLAQNLIDVEQISDTILSGPGNVSRPSTGSAADRTIELANGNQEVTARVDLAGFQNPSAAIVFASRYNVDLLPASGGRSDGTALQQISTASVLSEQVQRPDWTATQPFIRARYKENNRQFKDELTQKRMLDLEWPRYFRSDAVRGIGAFIFSEQILNVNGTGHTTPSNQNQPKLEIDLFARPLAHYAADLHGAGLLGSTAPSGDLVERQIITELDPWARSVVDISGAFDAAQGNLTPSTTAELAQVVSCISFARQMIQYERSEAFLWYRTS